MGPSGKQGPPKITQIDSVCVCVGGYSSIRTPICTWRESAPMLQHQQ